MNVVSKGRFVIRFKVGRLYQITRDPDRDNHCTGCVLRYRGEGKSMFQVKHKRKDTLCWIRNCVTARYLIENDHGVEEEIGMVKFCKKLKEKLDGEKEKN